jgi:UDP-N-acetylmuramyl pentapeptide phosphotransferase/UDP-N-acetylglucosamine-1-phosphate transferase
VSAGTNWVGLALLTLATLAASWITTRATLGVLVRRAILDRPNARSSHDTPTPRGGGLAVIAVLIPAWIAAALVADGPVPWLPLVAAAILAAVSWRDDVRSLGILWRLGAQILAVAAGLASLGGPVFHGLLPAWLDALAAGFLWLWFVNLYNFMDGIDGITAVETASIGGGVALVAFAAAVGPAGAAAWGIVLAATALGFLPWNWQRAKLFLGDVGSVPLGYLAGWLLLSLAAAGAWKAALILPLYYLADATITLLRRLKRGEKVWQAHREHYYQRAVQGGMSHASVVKAVLAGNLALAGLALGAETGLGSLALVMAGTVAAILLYRLTFAQAPGSA